MSAEADTHVVPEQPDVLPASSFVLFCSKTHLLLAFFWFLFVSVTLSRYNNSFIWQERWLQALDVAQKSSAFRPPICRSMRLPLCSSNCRQVKFSLYFFFFLLQMIETHSICKNKPFFWLFC